MSDPGPPLGDWLVGGGEMGKLVRSVDWSKTPLGPVESWPQSLRTAVSLCLASNFPISLAWGPGRVQIYNDGYWPICGGKHPRSMGQDFKECWFSAWPAIGEAFESAAGGQTAFLVNQRMFLDRNGYLEETFFTFSFSPIRDETGGVVGLFHPVTELTQQTLAERRLKVLRDLADRTSDARTVEKAAMLVTETLGAHALDLPCALLYLLGADGRTAWLAGSAGLPPGTAVSPALVDLGASPSSGWPLAEAACSGQVLQVDHLEAKFGPLSCGPYPESPKSAFVLPIAVPGLDHPLALLVAGVSARRELDEPYRTFYLMLRESVTNTLINARAYEEERKRAEALAEIDRAKTAFFSNVSHEFRTPLTLMLGPVEDVLAKPMEQVLPENRELLTLVHRNGLRLQKLVNTLLDFSRIEAGRVQAVYEPNDLGPLTAELASNFRSACERAGLRLITDCPPLGEVVYVDRDMWEKVVLNLVSNAFKFTFEGEIAVTVRRTTDAVELLVRDTGTGIPPEEMPHLFERFHRVKGARGRTHEGTGIGLALVQELVKLHGGGMRVESTPGVGSTFVASIPTGKAHLPADRVGAARTLASTALGAVPYVEEAMRWLPDLPDASWPSPGLPTGLGADFTGSSGPDVLSRPATKAAHRRARILLAEDNADMRDYVRRLLEAHFDAEAVPDGRAALAAVRARRPDLVVADVMMPNLDGFGLLRELRADPETRTLPVILLSARAGEESRVEGLERGADDYVVKPFSARELLARVSAHVELSRVRHEAEQAIRESERRAQAARTEAEAANRTKDEFLAMLSHELRTPLNVMLGWVRMLQSGRLDDATAQRALEVLERSVSHQSRLVSDLLDVSRIISGRLTLERTAVDLAAVVAHILETMRPPADDKGIALISHLDSGPVPVHGDAERLRQVIANLVSNAVKFTPSGGEVRVGLTRAGDRARLSVSDTGRGISSEFLPLLFERFRQADAGSARAQGLGLGLAIVRHIVELHGGSVSAESAGEGKGATFTVELPVTTPGEVRSADAVDAGEIAGACFTALDGVRVLIVEDDADSRDLLTSILTQRGAEVMSVERVREALAAARHARPDVIVCDLAMPGDDGFVLIRELRSWPSDQGGEVPALALTAYARVEDRERALGAGFQLHLSKPVDPDDVVEAVARLAAAR